MPDVIKFGELFSMESKSKRPASQGLDVGKYPFFTSSTIKPKFISEFDHEGDALIIGDGGAANITFYSGRFSASDHCYIAKSTNPKILPKYAYYFLLGNMHVLEAGFKGAGLKNISKSYIEDIKIPVPTLEKQNKIINTLDLASSIIQKRKETIKKLNEFLQAVFLDMFGDPVLNPKKWEIRKLSSLGQLERGRSKHRPRNAPELLNGPYPLIQTGDVANAGRYITGYTQTYSDLGLKQSRMWPKGTLCITIAANIAEVSILTFDACFPDSIVGFTSNKGVLPEYVLSWFSFVQKSIEDRAPESAQKNINLKILSELSIPLPPSELQYKFTQIVNEIEYEKRIILNSLEAMKRAFNSLLNNAFGVTR